MRSKIRSLAKASSPASRVRAKAELLRAIAECVQHLHEGILLLNIVHQGTCVMSEQERHQLIGRVISQHSEKMAVTRP